jgi:hypothetical protein
MVLIASKRSLLYLVSSRQTNNVEEKIQINKKGIIRPFFLRLS